MTVVNTHLTALNKGEKLVFKLTEKVCIRQLPLSYPLVKLAHTNSKVLSFEKERRKTLFFFPKFSVAVSKAVSP